MDRLDPQFREVYAEYGIAMGEAQLLERYLVFMIMAVYENPFAAHLTSEEYDEMLARYSKDTLGNLIRELKRRFDVPLTFAARLVGAQRLRNWLAHHYWQDRAEAFQTDAGRVEMIRELENIGEELYELWGYFDALLVDWLRLLTSSTKEFVERFRQAFGEA